MNPSRSYIFRGLLVLLPVLAFAGCSGEKPAPQQAGKPAPAGPDQLFVAARFVVTEGGATNAILQADSVMIYQARKRSIVKGHLRVDFFSRQGEQTSTLVADRGIVYGMTESIDSLRAEGNVVVTWNKRKATMETPFIRWIGDSRMVYADSTVVLTVDTAVERGVGFAAPDDLKSYTMGQVTGVIEDQKIEIPGR